MFYSIIQEKSRAWARSQTCPMTGLLAYIRNRGALRETQIAAIETYLFLKIEGRGRPLAKLFAEGFFNRDEDLDQLRISQIARERFAIDTAALALFQLCSALEQTKGSKNRGVAEAFERQITANPAADGFADDIHKVFYEAKYTDYLFSLPMGAGKTFLMAAFIYLDLYFAINEPENEAFARNFIVLVPSGLKTSIIPSLRTIEHFDPSWVLPEPSASAIRKLIKFEVLDQPKSARKSNRVRNPNVQKVAAHMPFEDLIGLVLVVNAEKVILDRVEVDANMQLVERNDEEKERLANELRHLIGKIPRLQIFIDEVQRAASGDIKLRAVVNGWCRTGQISAVLGFSGTPYHDTLRTVEVGPVALQSATIANTVYYYPLATAIADFLKKPKLEIAVGLEPLEIVRTGVERFMSEYGTKTYANGTCAKLAVYCGTIARLEEEIYPLLVGDMGIPADRILKFHQGNRTHPIGKEAAAEFALLDDPASRKQIILLVQIGKEGWDCRSLTGVILSQKGDCPKNMVLQTSCRCLRQVDKDTDETALILLNETNAKVLDKQLGEEQNTSIKELNAIHKRQAESWVPRVSRMTHLTLPPVDFFQLKIKYLTVLTGEKPDTANALVGLDPDSAAFKTSATITTRYLNERHAADNHASFGLVRDTDVVTEQFGGLAFFSAWQNEIVRESLGALTTADLRPYRSTLHALFDRITYDERGQRRYNTLYEQSAIRAAIRLAFRTRRELHISEDVIERSASLLIVNKLKAIPDHALYWPDQERCRDILSADSKPAAKPVDSALIEQKKRDLEKTAEELGNPELAEIWIKQLLTAEASRANSIGAKDRTLHYLPYDFTPSGFERDFIVAAVTLSDVKEAGLEIYYNGERDLTEFKIDCYARTGRAWRRVGFYTPDFLLIRRDGETIRKVLILETKGKGYADQSDFVARRTFVENDFLRFNNEKFGYERFDFLELRDDVPLSQNLTVLSERIRIFFSEKEEFVRR